MFTILISLIVVAILEFINRLRGHDYSGALTILVGAVIGAIAGSQHLLGLPDILSGTVAGLTAVGIHTVASAAGGK